MYEAIEKLMCDNGICGDVQLCKNGVAIVEINWGDWKHSHARFDYLMKKTFNAEIVQTVVTESDGSDVYSAKHIYILKDEIYGGNS